ncbi:MAG TPA: TonB-dependent receptor, partial [Polyangiales bacterium]|nr:TonB-dependent receptor [Polyangiales bacterium]
GDVKSRSIWGIALELGLRPSQLFELQLGARADAWVQSGGAEAVADPRARVILHATDTLDFHVAAGIVHQPAVFFLPLPGIADLANDRGLQSAIQSEAGVGWDTPLNLRVELQLFYHRYRNLVFTDTLLLRDAIADLCGAGSTIDCAGLKAPTRIDGSSYGFELFLRRPITESLSGFISYTLAFSPISDVVGLHYTPSWDVRHVLNVVLQWQIGAGFSAGARAFIRSGKSNGEYTIEGDMLARMEERLPWFARVDLEAAYAWPTSWGRMRVALEWFNVAMAREPEGADCNYLTGCHTVYLPAIFFPNLSFRAEH